MADTARLTEVIEPEAKALGFELVRVKLSGQGEERTLQVMAEDPATGQLVVEQCMALSRRISDRIDAVEEAGEELIEGSYHLEVSSPGIDRPLTRPKDYADWAGHEARLKLAEAGAKPLSGTIKGIDNDVVLLATPKGDREIPFESIASAKLLLTDKLINATAPLSSEGADLIKTEG